MCVAVGFVGKNCDRNIDDCALKPCNQGQCIDGVNNYTCNCTGSGFAGEFCQRDINECIISSPCQNRATCQNLFGTYKCFCQSGFSGRNCEVNIDDCERQPCENGGRCMTCFCYYYFILLLLLFTQGSLLSS